MSDSKDTRTVYGFKKRDAGPFTSKAEAEAAREVLVLERMGVPWKELDPDENDDVIDMLEIVSAKVKVYITDALERYDGFGTTTLEVLPHTRKGQPVRIVAILPEHETWQTMRYQSGMRMAFPLSRMDDAATFFD